MNEIERQTRRLPPPPPPLNPRATTNEGNETNPRRTAQTANRFRELNSFVDVTMAGLTGAEIATWLILWRDTKKGGTARTGVSDIARRAGVSPRAITKAIAKLKKLGLLRIIHQGGMNRGTSVYRVEPLAKSTG